MKKILIIGNMNAIAYKEVFPLIKENKIWTGCKRFGGGMNMIMPKDVDVVSDKVKIVNGEKLLNIEGVCWFTNLDYSALRKAPNLSRRYDSSSSYQKYDNYDAINVDKVCDIPIDYYGPMGVPINYIDKWDKKQFEIIDMLLLPIISGKKKYKRIIIRRKDGQKG